MDGYISAYMRRVLRTQRLCIRCNQDGQKKGCRFRVAMRFDHLWFRLESSQAATANSGTLPLLEGDRTSPALHILPIRPRTKPHRCRSPDETNQQGSRQLCKRSCCRVRGARPSFPSKRPNNTHQDGLPKGLHRAQKRQVCAAVLNSLGVYLT